MSDLGSDLGSGGHFARGWSRRRRRSRRWRRAGSECAVDRQSRRYRTALIPPPRTKNSPAFVYVYSIAACGGFAWNRTGKNTLRSDPWPIRFHSAYPLSSGCLDCPRHCLEVRLSQTSRRWREKVTQKLEAAQVTSDLPVTMTCRVTMTRPLLVSFLCLARPCLVAATLFGWLAGAIALRPDLGLVWAPAHSHKSHTPPHLNEVKPLCAFGNHTPSRRWARRTRRVSHRWR